MKETKDDTKRWKGILYSWTERINVVQMTTVTKAIQRFNAIPRKLPMVVFKEIEEKKS